MKRHLRIYHLILLLLISLLAKAQNPVEYKIEGSKIIANIDVNANQNLDSILTSFGFKETNLKNLESATSEKGWLCSQVNSSFIQLQLDKNKKVKELPPSFSMNEAEISGSTYFNQPSYGYNTFKKRSVFTKNETTTFFLEGFMEAQNVYLSGSFNEWSTLSMPMTRGSNGWKIDLKLPAGKHLYKYIVDGNWTEDKQNKKKENDLNGGYNSVYFVDNYTFRLSGYADASKVFLAGSFNNWRENEIRLKRTTSSWEVSLFVRPGTHAYKYIIDGQWTLDPGNAITRDDGTGNRNNFMSVGDTFYFRLKGFQSAKEVYCAGNFNGWNWNELKMHKSSRGWIIPYVLAPGNYEYKFKVDGDYITDPYNLKTIGKEEFRNSLLSIEPNCSFKLKGHAEAKNVRLVGDFNGWNPDGYQMLKSGDVWQIDIHLGPGKHLYKFVVDGEWIKDPNNTLWEKNQYNSQNSILWVKPQN